MVPMHYLSLLFAYLLYLVAFGILAIAVKPAIPDYFATFMTLYFTIGCVRLGKTRLLRSFRVPRLDVVLGIVVLSEAFAWAPRLLLKRNKDEAKEAHNLEKCLGLKVIIENEFSELYEHGFGADSSIHDALNYLDDGRFEKASMLLQRLQRHPTSDPYLRNLVDANQRMAVIVEHIDNLNSLEQSSDATVSK